MSDLYQVLGVPRGAALDDIKRAYRKWVKVNHPDVAGAKHVDHEAVQEAYEVLSDPYRRAEYDRTGEIIDKAPELSPVEAQAQGWILGQLAAILRAAEPDRLDIRKVLMERREREVLGLVNARMNAERGVKKLDILIGRVDAKGRASFIYTAMEDAKQLLGDQLAGMDNDVAVLEEVAGILDDLQVEQLAGIGDGSGNGRGCYTW